jgi:hypothetical protein
VTLAEYYFADPRLTLLPVEHLSPTGMSRELAALLAAHRGWEAGRVALFDRAFTLYWERSAALAERNPHWPAPRRRHVALLRAPLEVRPYVQLLNTSAWTLYESDLDAELSHPEFAAYLLAHGDHLAAGSEVSSAAVHAAAWWFERSDDERAAFAAAAQRATRPDAAGLRAIADAIRWLRELRDEALRPLVVLSPHRSIPGTGLLVPRALEAEPPALVARTASAARAALDDYHAAWKQPDPTAVRALTERLAAEAPPLLVTGTSGRIVWDPEQRTEVGALQAELAQASGAGVRAVAEDLVVVERHTRAFLAAIVDPAALPLPPANTEQRGYSYLHRARRLVAYNLHEAGMERLTGPPLPYARAMLGARTAHEWAHLADAAGWVPRSAPQERFAALKAALADALDEAIAAAPTDVRAHTRADLAALGADASPGTGLTRILLTRMPDYRANLVARRFMSLDERETYVRHNIRTLRPFYPRAHLWRMLVRYLYEYQYLGPSLRLSDIADPHAFFLDSTFFRDDFLASGVLDAPRFEGLAAGVAQLCASYAVDESRFRFS